MTCKNCEASFDAKFCPACGQKSEIHAITIGAVVHDFLHALTHADKGFLLLTKELVLRPGIVAREYIEGKRKKYFNPLSFLVLTSALSAYLTSKTEYFEALSNRNAPRKGMSQLWLEVFEISNHNTKLFSLLLIAPLITICVWLFFRKPKYNLAENFVLHSFLMGEGNLVRVLIFVPLFLIFPQYAHPLAWIYQFLFFVYMIIAYRQFFRQNIILTILKTLLIMPLYIAIYWGVIFAYVYLKHLIIA
jgi:hypothetical protein